MTEKEEKAPAPTPQGAQETESNKIDKDTFLTRAEHLLELWKVCILKLKALFLFDKLSLLFCYYSQKISFQKISL